MEIPVDTSNTSHLLGHRNLNWGYAWRVSLQGSRTGGWILNIC